MKTLIITGTGSELHIKNRSDEEYENSYYFLNHIDSLTIDGEEVDYEVKEISDIISYLGYERGKSTVMWVIAENMDSSSEDLFDFEFEYEIPDADSYKIIIKQSAEDDVYALNKTFFIEVIEVNGEDIMSENTPDFDSIFVEEKEV